MYINLGSGFEILGNKTILTDKLPFLKIKKYLLNNKYNLNLIFHNPQKAKEMNIKYRNKKYIPNILTFNISDNDGEIYICLSQAKKEYKKFGLNYEEYITLLFIHGILHLKGMDHHTNIDEYKMSDLEYKILNKYKIHINK